MIVNLLSFQVNIFTPTLSFLAQCFPALLGSPGLAFPGQPVRRTNDPPDLLFYPAHPPSRGEGILKKVKI